MSKTLELFMEKASIREEVRRAVKELSEKPLKEIIAYVLKGEVDSTGLYRFLYENLPDGYPREKFREFLEMEKSHDLEVSRLFRTLFPGEEVPEVNLKSWVRVFSEKDYRLRTVGDYLRVLEIGMDAEQLSEMAYRLLAELLEDPEHKKLMESLAQDEREHYEFLKQEYDFYSKVERQKALKELVEEIKRDKKR
ncbi:ferritin family protein [Thermococcus sp. 21S9]|uniref:ferritin-like domain-containing protein n=1 Tax=Thermococcus sp. 21S9 TaxID=1638223 RepID=UPI00143A6874|nr:ferritin family protein [Thermococcus sp. 21S9]NJE55535.1 rubrerythrin [Thermococcus sp. 21S9]